MKIEITKANVEDALAISIVNAFTWKTRYTGIISERIINERMKNVYENANKYKERIIEDGQYIVAKVDGVVVGFSRYGKSEKYENFGELYALYLLECFNGYGIGKMLFEKTKEQLKSMGYQKFVCNCLTKNPTMEFYAHMGGEKTNEFLSDIHGEQYSETTFIFKI